VLRESKEFYTELGGVEKRNFREIAIIPYFEVTLSEISRILGVPSTKVEIFAPFSVTLSSLYEVLGSLGKLKDSLTLTFFSQLSNPGSAKRKIANSMGMSKGTL
jgi:hypothetical protein